MSLVVAATLGLTLTYQSDGGADLYGLALLDQDLLQLPGGGRGDLGIDLVGRDLNEELVLAYLFTLLLEPFSDRPLDDRFAELRHLDLGCHTDDPPLVGPIGPRSNEIA